MSAITKAEREERGQLALGILVKFIEEHGYSPSRREISELMGLASPNSAQKLIDRLEAEGLVEVHRGIGRGVKITSTGMKAARRLL